MSDNRNNNENSFEPTSDQSLMADRALGEVAPEFDDWREPDEFELAAAEAAVVYAELEAEQMPDAMRSRLESLASQGAWKRSAAAGVAGRITPESAGDREIKMPPLSGGDRQSTGSSAVLSAAGWLVAAAAITIAAVGWMRPPATTAPDDSPIAANPSVEDRLAALENAAGTVSSDWIAWAGGVLAPENNPREGASEVSGKFVWNETRQEGYMVFENMPVNDPTLEQYQLWLVSADHEHPIDGGVFNIATADRVIVPINPKIYAGNLAALGVTVEKPGGVVVSSRQERLVAGLVPQG